jgi:hypothetical protein
MSITPLDLIDTLAAARGSFLRHLDGLSDEGWAWKPYPEAKNIYETLAHLRVDDLMALESLQTGGEPGYEAATEMVAPSLSQGREALLQHLADSHAALLTYLRDNYADAPLDTPICVWGSVKPVAVGIPFLSSEDYYHAGQVAFIRLAQDPTWDYYASIYGG